MSWLVNHSFFMPYALQAQDNIMNLPLLNGWGEKHKLFVKWKYVEAKVCSSFLFMLSLYFLLAYYCLS